MQVLGATSRSISRGKANLLRLTINRIGTHLCHQHEHLPNRVTNIEVCATVGPIVPIIIAICNAFLPLLCDRSR